MPIISFLSLNGTEITEHGRKISITEVINANEVELDSGIHKRYIKQNKKEYKFQWSTLPARSVHTADLREGRNFLANIGNTTSKVLVLTKLSPDSESISFYAYVKDYSEKLIRRDIASNCDYYDVSLGLEEV